MATQMRHGSTDFLAGLGLLLALASHPARAQTPWSFAGADMSDSHAMLSAPGSVGAPTQITTATAPRLTLKWSYETQGDISATPTVEPGGLYVPDWSGMVYKLNPATGALIWSHKVSAYTQLSDSASRGSPAIGSSVIVIGDMTAHPTAASPGARVIAINKTTGALAWITIIDTGPYAAVTGSPVIYGNSVYVGLVGKDEGLAYSNPNFVPSTRGAVVALKLTTGAMLWKFQTVPVGYTGGASWGNSPVAWPARDLLIVGTGNNYSIPAAAAACVKAAGTSASAQLACLDPTDYVDSLLALDLETTSPTGRLKWSRRLQGADTWTSACSVGFSSCPSPQGADFDFGSAPNLAAVPGFVGVPDDRGGTSQGFLLGAGQKSGIFWGLNPANGGSFWSTLVGYGGIVWGSAIDIALNKSFFASLDNAQFHYSNTLAGQNGRPVTWNAGAWGAIDITTGAVAWQIPAYGYDLQKRAFGSSAPGPNSFSNGVVFTGSTSGFFVALNAATGTILWKYNSRGTVESAPAIFNETVYWGTGYAARGGVGYHKLCAFSVP